MVGRTARWTRHGLPAGVSTVLAFLSGALTNVFTEGWSWPVGVGLGVLLAGWVGWEMHQAAAGQVGAESGLDSPRDDRPAGRESVVPHQLPSAVRHFAGRTDELAALSGLLEQSRGGAGDTVVVAVIGGAGIGKTALAVHWAHRVRERYPDGQLYVNLRGFHPGGSVVDPAEAVRGFLDALGVPAQRIPADPNAQAALYRSQLADRRVLVVLDNARDAAQVRPLLPGASGCLVLVTSRNQLSGLIAADGAHPLTLDLLPPAEARELLARRLGAGRVTADPQAVDEIVTRCARLPLALAIVAARAAAYPQLPLPKLAGELGDSADRLDTLTTDDPATDVRAVFSWSYRALSLAAGRLFRLLGLHPGPDISAAAAASLAALALSGTPAVLTELVRANLLVEPVPGRYVLHDLLRAYAADLGHTVDTDPQRRAATRRMFDHYLHTAHAGARLLNPRREAIPLAPPQDGAIPEHLADRGLALDWFTAEHTVLLAVIDHAAATGFDTHTWQLAWTLAILLDRRGLWHDYAATGRVAVAAARRLADPTAQARAHANLAHAYNRLGRLDDAHTHLRSALDLYRRTGDLAGQGYTQLSAAAALELEDRPSQALDHARQALGLFRAADHQRGQAEALNSIGWFHALLGDHRHALTCCQQALTLLQELDERDGLADTSDSLGYAHHHLGDHTQAIACYQHAVTLYRELGERHYEADSLNSLGDTHRDAGDPDAARAAWQQALTILDQLDHPGADEVRRKLQIIPG